MTDIQSALNESTRTEHDSSGQPARFTVRLPGVDAELEFARDAFDSAVFQREIGRIVSMRSADPRHYRALLENLIGRVRSLGYAQVLRRVSAADLVEVWSLENTGFELMDVGLTFARTLSGPLSAPAHEDVIVRPSTDSDIEAIVGSMLQIPWGSRYESDPQYAEADVRELRKRWLWNSHRGRAAAVLIGEMDGRPAGYVTCLLDKHSGHGEIELVGTLPDFRGRRVASRTIEHALAWFSTRTSHVTVRTQATNFAAAALYEKSGFTLAHSDLTFRLQLTAN